MDEYDIVDVKETTLDEWLAMVRNPPAGKIFVRNMFPTDGHKKDWLKTAHRRPESEVKHLLRSFLVSTGSNLKDQTDVEFLVSRIKAGTSEVELCEHDRRLLRYHLSQRRTA